MKQRGQVKGSGLTLELRVGQAVCLRGFGGVDSEKITLILEQKSGQVARMRIQAGPSVKVGRPEEAVA